MQSLKRYFPIFEKYPTLAYLDNAATTQRPKQVIDRLANFYRDENANIHRGVYTLSNKASSKYEAVRKQVAQFLGSENPENIGFTKGTTESINVVAQSFLEPRLRHGDNIIVTILEHHANFLPWQELSKKKGVELRVVPVSKDGELDLKVLKNMLDANTAILAVNHVSNTLGTVNPIAEIIAIAQQKNIPVLIDAAQSAAYYELNAKELDYDFLTFSAHKLFGTFGIGVLFVADRWMSEMLPYNYGGGMISEVKINETSYCSFPFNLEAGTPNIAGVIGLGSAIEFVQSYNQAEVRSHLENLSYYGREQLESIDQVKLVGNPEHFSGIISFTVDGIHPHDIATHLNRDHIAVRAGMHCTQPLLEFLETPATVRASFSVYNTQEEVVRLSHSIRELIKFWL